MKTLDPKLFTPLSEDEQELLTTIYRSRLRLFSTAFFVLFLMGLFYGQKIDSRNKRNGNNIVFAKNSKDVTLSRDQMKFAGILWLEIPILSVGLFIFFRRINCVRKDIADGNKYCIYHTVIRKQYFPLTNQYFIILDDPDYMHHEVDATWYDNISDGDAFPVYFSRYARYVFNKNGSYTLL